MSGRGSVRQLDCMSNSQGERSLSLSVVMPIYNTRDYLGGAIESVLGQTFTDFELILVDDGSTDGSDEIAADYARKDDRIRLILPGHHGSPASRNAGNELAVGSWLVVMDSDDKLLPEHLEKQLEFIRLHPNAVMVACLPYYIDESDRVLGRQFSDFRTKQDIDDRVANHIPVTVPHPGCFMRRDVILEIGGYRSQFWPCEDVDLINRVAQQGHEILINHQLLFQYRIHSRSVSVRDARKMQLHCRWIAACMQARSANIAEPDWETFNESEQAKPMWHRVNSWREVAAAAKYKSGVSAYSAGNLKASIVDISAATVLRPLFVPRLVWKRWAQPRMKSG